MRRKIAIVGGGHIGTVLGLALLKNDVDVSILTRMTPDELRAGRILSSQCIWGTSSAIEAQWAPTFWKDSYSGIGGFRVRVADQTTHRTECDIQVALESRGNSVDQRMKVSAWLEAFEKLGGNTVYGEMSAADIEAVSDTFDLVIVCAGKFRGDLGELFPVDETRSRYNAVQRIGAVVYLAGRDQPLADAQAAASEEWSVVPGIGDFFAIPAYANGGPCHIICMEGFVGGPIDQFNGVKDTAEILRRTRDIFEQWLPWEAGRWRNATLIDNNAAICGGFVPSVRHPVSKLPNGKSVLAFGDAHILLDPLTAQGANAHLKNLPVLLDQILAHEGPFTAAWMQATADMMWERSKPVDAVQEQYLNPRDHLWDVFRAADRSQPFANWWVNAHFNDPHALYPWIEDGRGVQEFLRAF